MGTKEKKKAANRDETESCSKATESAVSAITGEAPGGQLTHLQMSRAMLIIWKAFYLDTFAFTFS